MPSYSENSQCLAIETNALLRTGHKTHAFPPFFQFGTAVAKYLARPVEML
jgi:hypothetical protein